MLPNLIQLDLNIDLTDNREFVSGPAKQQLVYQYVHQSELTNLLISVGVVEWKWEETDWI